MFLIVMDNWETFTVKFAVDTGVAASYEWVGLGYIGQAGLSGSREKAYMAYRRAGPGRAQA